MTQEWQGPTFWERLSYWENSPKNLKWHRNRVLELFKKIMSLILSENGLKWKYLQPFNILKKVWFSSNDPTFSQSVILKLSILTLVGPVSQIKLSVSVCLFVSLSIYVPPFFENDGMFFLKLGIWPLRHCWGVHKHIKNSYLSPTPGLFFPIFECFVTFLFFFRRV